MVFVQISLISSPQALILTPIITRSPLEATRVTAIIINNFSNRSCLSSLTKFEPPSLLEV
jgi:hypothetical protein